MILSLHKNKKASIKQNSPNKNWLLQSLLNGTIEKQSISDEVQIEDVENKQKVSFPEANIGGGGSSTNSATNTNLLDGQISNILN